MLHVVQIFRQFAESTTEPALEPQPTDELADPLIRADDIQNRLRVLQGRELDRLVEKRSANAKPAFADEQGR